MQSVFIAGGGASGMMAAIIAARHGARVQVAERLKRCGKKLLATGNGRCNLTNLHAAPDCFHGGDAGFISAVLNRFDVEETIAFFEELGIECRTEEDGKVFPRCNQASAVLDVLRHEMARLGVEELCEFKIQEIRTSGGRLRCTALDKNELTTDAVIIAAGGKSAPNLGSNGGGYRLAEKLGHSITPLFPALVQVECNGWFFKRLKGLKIDAKVSAGAGGETLRTEEGEVLFAEYGLSGPPILQLSRIVAERAQNGDTTTFQLDLFPDWSHEKLAGKIRDRIMRRPGESIETALVGLIHKRLIPVLLQEAGIEDISMPCAEAEENTAARIAECGKAWRITATGPQTFMNSQVTAGGVNLKEVDARTLESLCTPGVYFCGEVLDVDGDCGGFNLQWAWSSGYVAGLHASGAADA